MSKIKTFRFTGSKCQYLKGSFNCLKSDAKDIDDVINDFISSNVGELIDIKIATVESMHHNNGGYNDVDLIYTIIYK